MGNNVTKYSSNSRRRFGTKISGVGQNRWRCGWWENEQTAMAKEHAMRDYERRYVSKGARTAFGRQMVLWKNVIRGCAEGSSPHFKISESFTASRSSASAHSRARREVDFYRLRNPCR